MPSLLHRVGFFLLPLWETPTDAAEESEWELSTRLPPTEQPYYAYGAYNIPLVVKLPAEDLVAPVRILLKAKEIASVRYTDESGARATVWPKKRGNTPLKEVHAAALTAIIDVLKREQQGAEADMLVRDRQFSRVPVTVTWKMGNTLDVEIGTPRGMTQPDVGSVEAVSERWGVALSVVGEATWSRRELALVDAAFGMLTEPERACIADVPVVVTDEPAPSMGPNTFMAGAYEYFPPRIVLYTDNMDAAWSTFLGSPRQPTSFTTSLILHELAHAISATPLRRKFAHLIDPLSSYRLLLHEEVKPLVGRDEGWQDRLEAADPALFERVLQGWRRLTEAGWSAEVEAEVDAMADTSAVEQGWLSVMGEQWRPTRYGSTDPGEGFADFFALVRADPAAMRRTHPSVVAWFEEGGHLMCQ